ncbi:MAG: class I SAM-dependent DNA methyltransferase [Dehalococcoidia bacterium]
MDPKTGALQTSYDRIAKEYADRFFDELAHKPLDRALLTCFAELVQGNGPVADIGCGPGQIARYLHERSLPVLGIDLSPAMVALAQWLTPQVTFRQGTMLDLDVAAASWGGITAFYSIIHPAPEEVPAALREFHRVLRPDGLLLLAFHVGDDHVHLDEWWDQSVDLDFHFYQRQTIEEHLEAAGFELEASLERRPYTPFEHPSQRAYLLARKPRTRAEF